MQTLNELKYSQSVWGFQAGKAIIRRVCDVKDIFRNRNHLQIDNDKFKQRCQIIPLKRNKLACPKCGTEILLCTPGRQRYVQGVERERDHRGGYPLCYLSLLVVLGFWLLVSSFCFLLTTSH